MIYACLRSTLAATLLVLPAVAWAGGSGSSSGTSSGTDSGTSSGTDSGTTDSGTTTGASSGVMCGECEPDNDVVMIVSPTEGATVNSPFDVTVTAPHTCFSDTCGEFADGPLTLSLRVDGSTIDTCQQADCDTQNHTFNIDLPTGTYELDALADHNFSVTFSEKVTITVMGAPGGDTTTGAPPPPPPPPPLTTGGGDSSTGEAPAENEPSGGCSCRSNTTPTGPLALGLLVLAAIRRRRD